MEKTAEGAPKMKEKDSPSVAEKIARVTGVGLIVGAGTLPDTRAVQAADIQKHIDSPDKIEQFEKQGMPSANALMEAGFQIGGQANPDVQSYSTPGVENVGTSVKPSFAEASAGAVEASQTITETFAKSSCNA